MKKARPVTENEENDRFENIDISVVHQGRKIILPDSPFEMTPEEGIKALTRVAEQNESTVSLSLEVEAYPLDGAYAFMKAMQRTYGWASPEPTNTWFGPRPPAMLSLQISPRESVGVIWGNFRVPNIEGTLMTGAALRHGRHIFVLAANVKRKHEAEIIRLAELTREIVRAESVFRGKPIQLHLSNNEEIDFSKPPTFMDVADIDDDQLIFNHNTETQIRTNIFVPIEKTERCRRERIPLKRTTLMTGTYGTGKTLTARVTAKKCMDNGWTFIMAPVEALSEALRFARMYQPAVVFAEDVDQVVSGERDTDMNDILNTIDGIDHKSCEVMTILTTNHVDGINPAMLRPGRLDAIVHVDLPDPAAAERLIRLYGTDLIDPESDLSEASEELKGQIPASIREAVERSKLFAISRLETEEPIRICGKDIAAAARGMRPHLDLLRKPTEVPPEDAVGDAIRGVLAPAIEKIVADGTKSLRDDLDDLLTRV